VADIMAEHGLSKEKVGLDGCTTELIYAEAFKKAGIQAVDGQAPMYEARMIKCQEEIECVRMACSNAEAAFSDIKRAIRPGITECEIVGVGQKRLYEKGADMAWEFVCSSGNRTNPLSIDYTDRSVRPGDLVIVDINGNCFNGYMTCYYRTFCCGKPNAEQEEIFAVCTTFLADTIKNMKAGVKVADVWHNIPTGAEKYKGWDPKKFGWNNWMESSAPAFGHGIGITLHETPWVGLGDPRGLTFEENMVIAMENWFGYKGGYHGVRLESMVVIKKDGVEYLDKWPIDKLTECEL
jgi:Xaa-Pro aminopeptidase